MTIYQKPYKTFDEQLEIIQQRGRAIIDSDFSMRGLQRLGYYRLSGYWYPFRRRTYDHREGLDKPSDEIIPGYTLDDIIRICDFDSVLRNILLRAIEQVEIAVRVAVAYEAGKHGAFAYLDQSYWGSKANAPSQIDPAKTQYDVFCETNDMFVRRSKESFAKHFREQYQGTIPIWAAIELWDFGTLSRFYQVMDTTDRASVASRFRLSSKTLQSWISALNDLRNFCAHHQRLNRRHFPIAPTIPRSSAFVEFAHLIAPRGRTAPQRDKEIHQLYPFMCILSFLTQSLPQAATWRDLAISHFAHVPEIIGLSLSDYGIPEAWTSQGLWSSS